MARRRPSIDSPEFIIPAAVSTYLSPATGTQGDVYQELVGDGKVGSSSDQVAAGNHGHDHNTLSGVQGGADGQRYHVVEPQAAIADAVGGDEVAKINDILAVLRAHGLIET